MAKYVVTKENTVASEDELRNGFNNFPWEIKSDFCDAFDEYIYQGVESGNLIEVKKGDVIASEQIFSPSIYASRFTPGLRPKIEDDITMAEFDERVADGRGLWNYLLESYNEIKENEYKVVIVKFNEGYRFVEIPE